MSPNADWWYEDPREDAVVKCFDCGYSYYASDIPLWLKKRTKNGNFTDDVPVCEKCVGDYSECGHPKSKMSTWKDEDGQDIVYCKECEGEE